MHTPPPTAVLVAILTGLSGLAHAQPAESDGARKEARERFSRGLHLFENGDNGGALAEFQRANELIPNRLVLFNIGLVYTAMDRPVEAAATLDQVLKDKGPLKPENLARAQAVKEEQEKRIALVEVTTNVPATIEVDGLEAGATPLATPLRVAAGTRVIGALASGHLPARREITVAGQTRAQLALELHPSEARLAHLEIRCALPGADVFVDGLPAGKTPLAASITVEPGTRVVEMRRAGYVTQRRDIVLQDGARGEIAFAPDIDAATMASSGRLRLQVVEGEILVTVDGRPRGVYREGITLPSGPHLVRLERAGFEPENRQVAIPQSNELVVRVDLRPTPETRADYVSRARSYRFWAWTTVVGGLVLGGGSGGLALWSNGKIPGAESNLRTVEQGAVRFGGGACDPSQALGTVQIAACEQKLANAQNSLSNYHDLRTGGIVGASVGVALIGVGVALFALGPDPGRYDRPESDTLSLRSLLPVVTVGQNSTSLTLTGRF
jgi:hypothetical protein